jgi:hypothetical protein
MSTQRREDRWQRRSCMERTGASSVLCDGFLSQGWRISELESSALYVPQVHAFAKVGTAPPQFAVGLATNSLSLDYRLVQLIARDDCRSSSPSGAERRTVPSTQTTHGLSLHRVPLPSALLHLHPSLPRVPAGLSRRTERYDGKGNLYLQHAA